MGDDIFVRFLHALRLVEMTRKLIPHNIKPFCYLDQVPLSGTCGEIYFFDVLKVKLDCLIKIDQGLFFSFAETGNINIEALGNIIFFFFQTMFLRLIFFIYIPLIFFDYFFKSLRNSSTVSPALLICALSNPGAISL